MRKEDFEPKLCTACGKLMWTGLSTGRFPVDIDVEKLSTTQELTARLNGRMIFQATKSITSFVVKVRSIIEIELTKNPIVLASHTCQKMTLFQQIDDAPNYWPPKNSTVCVSDPSAKEGFPF
jgi:hypothetical protein